MNMEERAPDQTGDQTTRRAQEVGSDITTAARSASEPLNDGPDYRPVLGAPNNDEDSLPQTDQSCLVKDQPSHEDVTRLEEEKESIRRNNEAKNVILDAIYDQVPKKIKKMLDNYVGSENRRFSQLTAEELKRLTKWLTEREPFKELIKEDDLEHDEEAPLSIEEENSCSTDGVRVFSPSDNSPILGSADSQPSKGKKMVQRTKSVLGCGTYGEVRIVRHKGRCYAAKELKLHSTDHSYIDNLYREAATLALLEHKNIVAFCGIGVYQGERHNSFLILTELLATSLHRYNMKEPSISVENHVSILFDVLNGLEYMHQDPVVIHGDLKTRNILLSKSGIAKIADLGSSRLAHDKITRCVCGTPAYMAPEMAREQYTEKIDVFAYGHLSLVTLTRYEMSKEEFDHPSNSTDTEISMRRELFSYLEEKEFDVIRHFVPLVKDCLRDDLNRRPFLSVLKTRMRSLRLPRELPNVSIDTAVQNES